MTSGKFNDVWVPYYISLFSLSKIIFIPIASGPPSDFLESGPTESLIQMMRTINELIGLKMFTMKTRKIALCIKHICNGFSFNCVKRFQS